MKKNSLLAGAILLLALALFANAAALLLRTESPVLPQVSAQGNNPRDVYFLGADTYFVTAGGNGDEVYLWQYKYHPRPEATELNFIRSAHAR